MGKIGKFISDNALWLSMVAGCVGYRWFCHLHPTLPYFIFLMLFFTFCKVNPLDLRLHRWHGVVLGVQLALGVGIYYALHALTHDPVLSQGIMICILMPTATAAPIIAGKLGGSIQNLTSFTLLSNFATAIIVPAFFPLVNPAADMTFWPAFWLILRRITPLLLGPFLSAWALRLGYNAWQRRHGSDKTFTLSRTWAQMPFYIWVISIVVLMADLTKTLVQEQYNPSVVLWLCVGSLVCCLAQFGMGKFIGRRLPAPSRGTDYRDVLVNPAAAPTDMPSISAITAGQAFGQKNTTLAIWMAQAYLNPLSALAPAAYIIWQNFFNSWQLLRAAKGKKV